MRTPRPSSTGPFRRLSGFTLIELLVVIVIIGILASVSIPIMGMVKAAASSTRSSANLKELGKALAAYQGDNQRRYPAVYSDSSQIPELDNWVSELIVSLNQTISLEELLEDPHEKIFVSPNLRWQSSGDGFLQEEEILNTYSATDALVGMDPIDDSPDPDRGRLTSSYDKTVDTILLVEGQQEGNAPYASALIRWTDARRDFNGGPGGASKIDFRYQGKLNVLYADYSVGKLKTVDTDEIEEWHWSGRDYPDFE